MKSRPNRYTEITAGLGGPATGLLVAAAAVLFVAADGYWRQRESRIAFLLGNGARDGVQSMSLLLRSWRVTCSSSQFSLVPLGSGTTLPAVQPADLAAVLPDSITHFAMGAASEEREFSQ